MLVKQQENFNAQMEELRSFFKGSAGSLAFNGTKIKKRYTQLIKDLDEHFKQTGLEVKPDDIERYVFEAVPTMHLLSQASNTFSVIANPKDVIRATKRHQLLVGKKDTKLNAFMKNAEISWDNRKYFDILKIPKYVKEGETLRAPDAFDTAFNMIQNNVLKPAWMIRGALALRIAPEEALRAAFGGKINPFTSAFKRLSLTSNKYYDFFGEGRADQVAQVYDNTGNIVLTTQMTPDSIELLKNFIDVEDVKKFQAINYDKAQKLIKNSMLETNYKGEVSEYMVDAAVNGFDLRQIKFAELTDKDFVAKTKSIKATAKGSIVGYDGNTYNSMGEAFIKGGGFTTDLDERRFFDLKTRGSKVSTWILATIELTSAAGNMTADAGALIDAVGQDLTLGLGDETAFTDVDISITGFGLTSALGAITVDLNQQVDVTGNELTSEISSVTIVANADVSLTGIGLTSNIGDADAVSVVEVSGISLSANIGSVTISANADVSVTGQALSTAVGSTIVTAWAEIDPNVNQTFTEVTTGVNQTWIEVDKAA